MTFRANEIYIWASFFFYSFVAQMFSDIVYIQSINILILFSLYFCISLADRKNSVSLRPKPLFLFLFLLSFAIFSSLGGKNIPNSLAMLALYIFVLFSILVANMRSLELNFPRILSVYSCVVLAFILMMISLNNFELSNRLSYIRAPNSLALILVSTLPGIAYLKPSFRFLLYAILAFLVFVVESRNGLIASAIYFYTNLYFSGNLFRHSYLAKTFLSLVFLGVVWSMWGPISDILLLDNEYRGSGTFFTGRGFAWLQALNTIQENLIFGVGIGNSALYFQNIFGVAGPAGYEFYLTGVHNGYLKILMEFGVPSALLIFWLIAKGLRGIANQTRILFAPLLGFSASYLFFNLFEETLFGLGNPASLIFLVVMVLGLLNSTKTRSESEL